MSRTVCLKFRGKNIIFLLVTFGFSCSVQASDQAIQNIVNDVSQSQYQNFRLDVESCGLGLYDSSFNQGYRSRDGWAGGGNLGNQEAALYLRNKFSEMGLSTVLQGTYSNVVAELTGTVTPEKIYVLGGHYDTYGNSERAGGDDNASGTAGLLEAARILSQYSFECTIRFIGFNAEEDGLKGSSDYVNNMVLTNNETIAGMINLDMILRPGWDNDPTQMEDLDIITLSTTDCLDWAHTFITAAQTYVPSLSLDGGTPSTSGWNASDQYPFISAGFPAILAIENTANEIWYSNCNAYYHSPEDANNGLANNPLNPSGVTYNYAFASDVVRTSVATLAQEAVLIPEPATILTLVLGGLAMLGRKRF
jgi:Zn-dependent M28 family amino/carboxypeptidase